MWRFAPARSKFGSIPIHMRFLANGCAFRIQRLVRCFLISCRASRGVRALIESRVVRIQKVWRGYVGRRFVKWLVWRRERAARAVQSLWKGRQARRRANVLR